MKISQWKHRSIAAAISLVAVAGGAQTTHRPPAVPLIVNDPYLSIWSMSDTLTESQTMHWSEAIQPLTGLLRVDGKVFRWMGTQPRTGLPPIEAMQQTGLEVTPLHTRYRFSAAGLELRVTFFSPLFPQDLDVMSRPVTYLSWSAVSTDGRQHKADLLLDVSPMVAVNDRAQPTIATRAQAGALTVLRVGTRDQQVLHQSGDRIRIDWGYFDLCVPKNIGAVTELSTNAMQHFVDGGSFGGDDDLSLPLPAMRGNRASGAHLAVAVPFGSVKSKAVEKHVLLGYSDGYSIEYLGRKLSAYWQHSGMSESTMLNQAEIDYTTIERRGKDFDSQLTEDMTKVGGADYAYMTSMLFRQTIAAHKLVADIDGTPMLFSKENDSNGCIDTVDVTYPSSPFFLLFNPKLLEAQLEPLMRYSALPRWKFPFAPHDLGTYPLANGQVYGGGEENELSQMPVEESGNLLIMIAALGRSEGNWEFARRFMPQLKKWAAYLEQKGLDPENQLSTDDFAGHLAHNTNLSIKAIEALGAFVQIARGVGDSELASRYEAVVRPLPAKWQQMGLDGDHYKLAFDQPGTWSQKYNLVWDDFLGLHLFPNSVAETEWAFYAKHVNAYGLPLDNRKTYTKLDWEVWTASLSHDPAQSADLIHRLVVWMDSTPSRVPTTDWYDTVSGKRQGFQARSVVGGVFIKALMDPAIEAKYKVPPQQLKQ